MTQNSSIAFVDTESGTQLVTRLNNVGETLRTTSRGTARPAYAAAGTLWVDSDTPGSGVETLHFFDGTDDLTVALLDVTNNRVKHTDLLIGASLPAAPDGKLHVHTASAGAVSALSSANDIVIEDSGDAGLSILVGSNSSARIVAGHSGDNDVGYIQYGIAEKRWQIGADAGEWYYFNDNGLFGIRETVNTFMTTGLTVNQDTADDEILAFKIERRGSCLHRLCRGRYLGLLPKNHRRPRWHHDDGHRRQLRRRHQGHGHRTHARHG